jgi:hypothetical protein
LAALLVAPAAAHADDDQTLPGSIPTPGANDYEPEGDDAPKGEPEPRRSKRTPSTSTLSATDSTSSAFAANSPTVWYFYNSGIQSTVMGGLTANLRIEKPWIDPVYGYHTLAELAAIKNTANGRQIVEIGWTVDSLLNGDDDPHMFVYHWVNGQETCYNGCGFVRYTGLLASPLGPGDTLPTSVAKKFIIQINALDGSWWVGYDNKWVGYFPAAEWTGASPAASFTATDEVQAFGEVATSTNSPCTDMGSGDQGGSGSPATYIGSTTLISTLGLTSNATLTQQISPAGSPYTSYYTMSWPSGSTRTFYYGGDGAC